MKPARALALSVLLAVTAGCTGSGGRAVLPSPAPTATRTSAAVTLPPCGDPAAAASQLATATPPGAAENAITGQAVTSAFSLEGRAFVAEPPPPGYSPAVTADQARCELGLVTEGSGYGPPAGRLALATVTINPAGLNPPGDLSTYDHRVAWIFITPATDDLSAGCSTTPATASLGPPEATYSVFGIDAANGGSAFLFETSYHLCPGSDLTPAMVEVPYETVSVPWTLVSRSTDGRTAVVRVSWEACEFPPSTNATGDADGQAYGWPRSGRLDVLISRPFGPACGPARPHLVSVVPWGKGTLPATLQHGAIGVVRG